MTSRERILTTLQGGIPDRIGRSDAIWSETFVRWKKEGLQEGQDVGAVMDTAGNVLQAAVAPASGPVLFLVTSLAINKADPLLAVGA